MAKLTKSVDNFVAGLRKADQLDARGEALAELALSVARAIDAGDVNAQLVRELRSTLVDLEPVHDESDAFERIAAELQAAVHNTED